MLSLPKQIPVQSLLYKTTTCLTRPVNTFLSTKWKKVCLKQPLKTLSSEEMWNNALKINVFLIISTLLFIAQSLLDVYESWTIYKNHLTLCNKITLCKIYNLLLFSLQATQSNIYGGVFAKTVNSWKSLINFTKSSIIDFWLGSNTALGNTVKESSHLKHISPVL